LAFNFEFKYGCRIGHFCPNWAFNIAKVGSKTSPKSEVEAIDWLVKKQKSPGMPGLFCSQNCLRKRVYLLLKLPQSFGAPHSAMEFISN
jgi:hypothetical protein